MTTEKRSRPAGETGRLKDLSRGSTSSIPQDTEETLEAVIISVQGGKGFRTVTVRCPYCAKTHIHGWPDGQAPGHRLAHCAGRTKTFGRSYTIVPAVTS